MGAKPPSLLPVVFQDVAGYLIMFFSGWEQELASSEETPLQRESWVPGGRLNVSRAPSSQSSRMVHVWLAASIRRGWEEGWRGQACCAQWVSHLLSPWPCSLESLFAITACFDY